MKLLLPLALLLPAIALAEVADSSAGGFTLKISLPIQASPDAVYRKLLQPAEWWSANHTFSGSPANLTIEEKIMGCYCEKLPGGGVMRHMEVVQFVPGKLLVLSGAIGPMQALAAGGTMTFRISQAEGGAKLDLTYAVFGYLPAGLNTWAAPVNGALTEQVTRLKNLLEQGKP